MPASVDMPESGAPRVCVIGAGLGGLALAIRLQASGRSVTLLEAREAAGGCLGSFVQDGFRFDIGAGAIPDPRPFAELFALSGAAAQEMPELLGIAPALRCNWPDGAQFDWATEPAQLAAEIARISSDDVPGIDALAAFAEARHEPRATGVPGTWRDRALDLAKTVPGVLQRQSWRSAHSLAGRFVRSEKLREALLIPTVLAGAHPFATSSARLALPAPPGSPAPSYPRGGMQALVAALADRFEALGGTLRLGDPVTRIDTIGNRVSEVETRGGWALRFDAVASAADVVHTYRELLRTAPRGRETAKRLSRCTFGPGVVAVHFGVEGSWPGIPHSSVLFGPRFREFFDDIFDHGLLPRDMLIVLNHPSVTDPGAAPQGKSAFTALVPVPNMGKLPLDWAELGPVIEARVLAEVSRRLIPDLEDRIVTRRTVTPQDWARNGNLHLGSAYSLNPDFIQDAVLRPRHRDPRLSNFYLAGAATAPGAGVTAVLEGARRAAAIILEHTR